MISTQTPLRVGRVVRMIPFRMIHQSARLVSMTRRSDRNSFR